MVYFFSWQIERRDNRTIIVDSGDGITKIEGTLDEVRHFKDVRREMLMYVIKEYEEKHGTFDSKELFVHFLAINTL